MITKEEFIKSCDEAIPEHELDSYKKSIKKTWIVLAIAIGIQLLITAIVFKFWQPILFVMLIVCIISIIIIVNICKYKWKNFKKKYSHIAFDCLLKGYKYVFNPDSCISQTIFEASGFGGDFDDYRGEDLISIDIPDDDGEPSGVQLNVCDLYVTRQEEREVVVHNQDGSTSTKTERYTVTVYDGVFGYVSFPFNFKCNMGLNAHFKGEQRIKLEDIRFNKEFKTYTDNQMESLIILTPTFMEKLINFNQMVKKFKLLITKSGMMYFGLNANLFKLKKGKPGGKVFQNYYDDIMVLLSMVNEIKDNNKVFKM